MPRFAKPARPTPNVARGLWCGCLLAYATGWSKGFRADGSKNDPARELRGTLPLWIGSLDQDNYDTRPFGRTWVSGGASEDSLEFADINGRFDLTATTRQITAVLLVRPDVAEPGNKLLFGKKFSDLLIMPGWRWEVGVGNTWRFDISTGAAELDLLTNAVQSTQRTDFLVATYDQVNLRLFVNGAADASVASGLQIGNNDEPVRLFGADEVDSNTTIGMVAFWSRVLSAGEQRALYADPYVMFKPSAVDSFLGTDNV